VHEGNWLPLLTPVNEHLAPGAVGLVPWPGQVAVLPQPFYQFATLHLGRQVRCVKMITHDVWSYPDDI